ncbi:MAG: orotate phosphoribosyltransferase [Bacteroidales bacterium]|jgi:orotate phosphoribosyltransferase|nr:orotate phosphoribosyltransferase [Bacteroidales bacterium]
MNEKDTALALANFLLQIKAIKLNPASPFTWASGLKSPIYCDNRITLSYPNIRTFIREAFVRICTERFGKPDLIAGVATGGIPQGALVAQELGLPFCYVRSEAKSHGLNNQVEGIVPQGASVVVIEDLVSTGKSSLAAVEALREKGAKVKGMMAIFTYQLDAAAEAFKKANCDLVTISNYEALITKAVEENYVSDDQMQSLKEWRQNPQKWSDDHLV